MLHSFHIFVFRQTLDIVKELSYLKISLTGEFIIVMHSRKMGGRHHILAINGQSQLM